MSIQRRIRKISRYVCCGLHDNIIESLKSIFSPNLTTTNRTISRHFFLIYVIFALLNYYSGNLLMINAAKLTLQQQHSTIAEHRLIMQDRAILHINLMNTVGLCRDPRPLIVYPPSSTNKIFYPRGTIIHRCSDQTGCCPNPGELCRPETVENVEKVFFVNYFMLGQQVSAGQRIAPRLKAMKTNFTTMTETVTFVNHTSCKCIRLAPNTIEHDDIQSVISRPLVTTNSPLQTNSILYHLIGSLSILAIIIILFFIYKFICIHSSRLRNGQLV
ncbi:hypothetical protein DERP_001274 [Dermatophagoides pteronyssinus]|uniref:Platelet-derived growth factor (PDGF) family profile domain-containing protein n=2 Tax=Dermatophagoides pteronyssinus TaxID=6956 RepID=A0ABQ8JEH1_DERPT|nr:hypothetical protein DERP_001274 [Dermatophagoides pteronyssinus]